MKLFNLTFIVSPEELKHVKVDKSYYQKGSPKPERSMPFWTRLSDLNGGSQYANLLRAHEELKDLFSQVLAESKAMNIPLEKIILVSPELMDPSTWGGYTGAPWDKTANAQNLLEFLNAGSDNNYSFHQDHCDENGYHDPNHNNDSRWIRIRFAKRGPGNTYTCSVQ